MLSKHRHHQALVRANSLDFSGVERALNFIQEAGSVVDRNGLWTIVAPEKCDCRDGNMQCPTLVIGLLPLPDDPAGGLLLGDPESNNPTVAEVRTVAGALASFAEFFPGGATIRPADRHGTWTVVSKTPSVCGSVRRLGDDALLVTFVHAHDEAHRKILLDSIDSVVASTLN